MLPHLMRAGEVDLECAVYGASSPDDAIVNFHIWRHRNRELPVLDMRIVAHAEQFPHLIQSKFDVFAIAQRSRTDQEDRPASQMEEFFSGPNVGRGAPQTFDRRARYLDLLCVVYDAGSADELARQFSDWRDEPRNSGLLIMGIEINCCSFRIPEENVVQYNAFVILHSASNLRAVQS